MSVVGLKRKNTDKFYTNTNVVNLCINNLKKYININPGDLCIEPSAGSGSFISQIKLLCKNYLFLDLEPEHNEIIKMDYLNFNYKKIKEEYEKIHIIGNPPFGRQSSLAKKFIKYSSKFCDSISFILPKSFKKDSFKKSIPINFHLEFELDIPENAFLINNKIHNVPCVFQIWIKKDFNRIIPKKIKPLLFKFVKKNKFPDISFRRVGINAGNIDKNIISKSEQSHYFIKFNQELTDDLFNKLKAIKFLSKDNTVGPRSISKQELIKEYNLFLSQ